MHCVGFPDTYFILFFILIICGGVGTMHKVPEELAGPSPASARLPQEL